MPKQLLTDLLLQNQLTCRFAFQQITSDNAHLRLNPQAASVGFIYRHIGETMNLFGYFLGMPSEVTNTTMGHTDEGQGNDVEESSLLLQKGFDMLQNCINSTPDEAWNDPIDTPFFGTVSRMRIFSHVLFHNAHHAGQIALTLSKGA